MPSTLSSLSVSAMDRERRYYLSGPFWEVACRSVPDVRCLRVLHVLVHAVCRTLESWHGTQSLQPAEGYMERSNVLRARMGQPGSRDNRALAAGLKDLEAAGLVEWSAFHHGGEWCAWRLPDAFFDLLFDGTAYGLFDIGWLPGLETDLDLALHGWLGLRRRMRRPEWEINLGPLAAHCGRSADWTRLRPAMTRSLQRLARLWSARFLVVLMCEGRRRGIDTLLLRMTHSQTLWRRDQLGQIPVHGRKVLMIDAARCVDVGTRDVPMKLEQAFRPVNGG